VVYRWLDDDPHGWRDWHLAVTIGDKGARGVPRLVDPRSSDCLDPTGVPEEGIPVPAVQLLQNKPNPFNPRTVITFELTEEAVASLRVYDTAGRLVKELVADRVFGPGPHEIGWDGRDESGRRVVSGTYFYRLETGHMISTKRMMLIR
jgi:hypothetical protein